MKNQYLGDIGDYGKYGLLRFLASKGIRIGVNWYLTEDDNSNDGKFKEYLDREKEPWMIDGDLYDKLQRIKADPQSTVIAVEALDLIPRAVFYANRLDLKNLTPQERAISREQRFSESVTCLQKTDLIFSDPDNGISFRLTARAKNNEKYILPSEIETYYKMGKDVVFYCHKGRRNNAAWLKVRTDLIAILGDAYVLTLTYHKGTQRSYIFAIHPEHFRTYRDMLCEFVDTDWKKVFEIEPVWQSADAFQKVYPTEHEKEKALETMTNEEIDHLISTSHNTLIKEEVIVDG